jgi:hypothetical protein
VLGRSSVMMVNGGGLLLGPVDRLRTVCSAGCALIWDDRRVRELSRAVKSAHYIFISNYDKSKVR